MVLAVGDGDCVVAVARLIRKRVVVDEETARVECAELQRYVKTENHTIVQVIQSESTWVL